MRRECLYVYRLEKLDAQDRDSIALNMFSGPFFYPFLSPFFEISYCNSAQSKYRVTRVVAEKVLLDVLLPVLPVSVAAQQLS